MSAATLSITERLAESSLETSNSSTKPQQSSGRWFREPISLLRRDVYSRLVIFDGKNEVCLFFTFFLLL